MARTLIFANPIAGSGQARRIAEALAGRLTRDRHEVHTVFVHPGELGNEQITPGTSAAIAIGGDGTIRSVAARLHAASPAGPIPMLIVPMGTANLLGQHLGIRWDPQTLVADVVQTLEHHRIRQLDAAVANGELFLLMAGIGIDAQIVQELDRLRTGPINYLSYLVPAAAALANYRFHPMTVTVDDRVIADGVSAVTFVANVKEYGTGFPILPDARSDDGLLDVCVLPCANPKDLLLLLLRAISGEHLAAEAAIFTRGKKIHVRSPAPIPFQIDGDPGGHVPVEIDLLPTRLRFIVPDR